jgi:hypothetical protein
MTKISFDLDFSKDSETLLKEIQDQAKAEVEKREGKERAKAYLSNLHETVNEKIDTSFSNITELIRALADHASPLMQERISGSTATSGGRRKTVSMNLELYEKIKEALAKPSPNKAKIARESNVSVVQVRKVAEGGYDQKFKDASDGIVSSEPKHVESPSVDASPSTAVEKATMSLPEIPQANLPPPSEIPEPENDSVIAPLPEVSDFDEESTSIPALPPPPSFNDEHNGEPDASNKESVAAILPPAPFGEEEVEEGSSTVDTNIESDVDASPPPVTFEDPIADDVPSPSLPPSLPPVQESFSGEVQEQETDSLDIAAPPPPPPALDSDVSEEANTDDGVQLPLPPVHEDLPNQLEPPTPPSSLGSETDSPAPPPSPARPAVPAEEGVEAANPTLSKKLGLKLGGASKKPSLKLGGKLGKANKPTLSITRPPMPKSLPPSPDS